MSLGRIIDDFVELFTQPLPLGAGVKKVSIMITLGTGAFVFQTIRLLNYRKKVRIETFGVDAVVEEKGIEEEELISCSI